MITVEQATARILADFAPLPGEKTALSWALGRVLAEDLRARVAHPAHDVSAMDGYAVRAADLAAPPVTLRVIGAVPAGGAFEGRLGPGEAVRIFTGAPMPAGADAVVIQENTVAKTGADGGKSIAIEAAVAVGRHIRRAGGDFAVGATCLARGQRLFVRHIALAAAMNYGEVTVRRKPRVAIVSTGDELEPAGSRIGPSRLPSSNGPGLAAFVAAAGGDAVDLGICRDNAEGLQSLARQAAECDLLVTSGGASVGDHDIVRAALGELGLELDFWKIAIRPGKPALFGRIGRTPVLGLPGNPVSTFVGAALFLGPAIDRMLGIEPPGPQIVHAVLSRSLPANDERQDYLRAALAWREDGRLEVDPMAVQDSAMLLPLAQAGGLLIRPPKAPAADAGALVPVIPLGSGNFLGGFSGL